MTDRAVGVRVDPVRARRITGRLMSEAQSTVPQFHVRDVAIAEALSGEAKSQGVSVTAVLLPLVAHWLVCRPGLNGHWLGGMFTAQTAVDLGLAIAHRENVLVVATFSDCANWTQRRFADELTELRNRSDTNVFRAEDFSRPGFTLSNLGAFGADEFTSIVTPPQVAVLSVGALKLRPTVIDGQVRAQRTLALTLGVDHRAIDGAYAATSLSDLTSHISSLQTDHETEAAARTGSSSGAPL